MAGLDDADRLGAIDEALLDGADDEELQSLARAAAIKLGVPMALVSLVAGRVQWFYAHAGAPAELARSRATSRCESFCQFVVRDEAMFEVSDARADVRVPRQLVDTYGVRAYLGAPVRHRDQVIGTFCVLDVVPRQFCDDQRAALLEFAALASARLSARVAQARREEADRAADSRLEPVRARLRSVERALLELGALARLGAGVDELSGVEVHRALSLLRELSESHGGLVRELRAVRKELDALRS